MTAKTERADAIRWIQAQMGVGEKRTTRERQGLTVHGIRKRLHLQ